jgi:hypothetical protein
MSASYQGRYFNTAMARGSARGGVWRLTPTGAAMSDNEIGAIPKRVREQSRRRRKEREAEVEVAQGEIAEDADVAEVSWKDRLLTTLLAIPPVAEREGDVQAVVGCLRASYGTRAGTTSPTPAWTCALSGLPWALRSEAYLALRAWPAAA